MYRAPIGEVCTTFITYLKQLPAHEPLSLTTHSIFQLEKWRLPPRSDASRGVTDTFMGGTTVLMHRRLPARWKWGS